MGQGSRDQRGRWAPRGHSYDHGEEPLDLGPGRPRAPTTPVGFLAALAVAGPLYGYIGFKLFLE
jgi:hypothetical protein